MLLDAAAASHTLGTSASASPYVASPGTSSAATRSSIHGSASSADALGRPVSVWATMSYEAREACALASPACDSSSRTFRFMRVQGASSAAHTAPCGAGKAPPITPAKPCTAPSLEFASARPPSRLHKHMPSRASMSPAPLSYARRRQAAPYFIPCNASASVTGLALLETKGSMHWMSASRPVAAVTAGGSSSVSSGSTTATAGNMNGLRIDTLRSPAPITALRVTSAPGPAVVGTATNRALGCVSAWPRPTTSRKSNGSGSSPPLVSSAATALPVSMGLPPPMATTLPHPPATAAAVASTMVSALGSPDTENVTVETPRPASSSKSGRA
mmetsp:Transcript_36171/g.93937  ORF Transcript_36171/g.93937 Transcript_36171/m.93937 type:complete len:330 (-) Transcript_36171:618-1607(-)